MKLVFLGKLADMAGAPERELHVAEPLGWDQILILLDPPLAGELRSERVKIARNGQVCADKRSLRAAPEDEIAFLPPVSGG